jgi:hypothetical protein
MAPSSNVSVQCATVASILSRCHVIPSSNPAVKPIANNQFVRSIFWAPFGIG